jgi:hypothetical protein
MFFDIGTLATPFKFIRHGFRRFVEFLGQTSELDGRTKSVVQQLDLV